MTRLSHWTRLLDAVLRAGSVREFYDRIAPIYDQLFVAHHRHAHAIAELVLERHENDAQISRVLDLGCGTGLLAKILMEHGSEVIGLDLSFVSLKQMRATTSRISAVQADAAWLPFGDDSFDAVVSLGAWRHFPDARLVMSEASRLLKPSGMLVIGYFPPALGGLCPQGRRFGGRWVNKMYQMLIQRFGYFDRTDEILEREALALANEFFQSSASKASGTDSRLVVAHTPR